MADIHDLQVIVAKGVDVAKSVQGIDNSVDQSKMIEMIKYMQEMQKKYKTVSKKDNAQKREVNNKNEKEPQEELDDMQLKLREKEIKELTVDEYRGHLIDIRS